MVAFLDLLEAEGRACLGQTVAFLVVGQTPEVAGRACLGLRSLTKRGKNGEYCEQGKWIGQHRERIYLPGGGGGGKGIPGGGIGIPGIMPAAPGAPTPGIGPARPGWGT